MKIDHLLKLQRQLDKNGRLREILDDDGKTQPSVKALEYVKAEHPQAEDAEKWRLAQARTLMDLAEKYQSELN